MYEPSSSHSNHAQATSGVYDAAGTVESAPLTELLAGAAVGGKRVTLPPGKVLYEPTAEARSLFFVNRGQVRTYRIDEQVNGRLLEILGPDDWCGEASLARQPLYGEQAVTVVTSIVTEISADRLLQLLSQHPKAAVELIKQLSVKLTAARTDAAGLVFDDCHSRLLKTLVRFSDSAAAQPHPEGVVLRITHQQLAQAVGVARETVSLALTQLRQQNVLRTGRNQLLFNPESLRTLARARAGVVTE